MVVMLFPVTAATGVTQERTGRPSSCTVQAPHSAMPQPNLVPVRPITSRSTQSTGMSGGTSTVCCVPFTFRVITAVRPAGPCSSRLPAGTEPARGRRREGPVQALVVRPLDEPGENDNRALRERGRHEPRERGHQPRQPVGLEVAHGVHRVPKPAVGAGGRGGPAGFGVGKSPPEKTGRPGGPSPPLFYPT